MRKLILCSIFFSLIISCIFSYSFTDDQLESIRQAKEASTIPFPKKVFEGKWFEIHSDKYYFFTAHIDEYGLWIAGKFHVAIAWGLTEDKKIKAMFWYPEDQGYKRIWYYLFYGEGTMGGEAYIFSSTNDSNMNKDDWIFKIL